MFEMPFQWYAASGERRLLQMNSSLLGDWTSLLAGRGSRRSGTDRYLQRGTASKFKGTRICDCWIAFSSGLGRDLCICIIGIMYLFCFVLQPAAVVKRSSVHWLSMVFYFSFKGTSMISLLVRDILVVVFVVVISGSGCSSRGWIISCLLVLVPFVAIGWKDTILFLHDLEVRQSLPMPLWKVTNRGEPLLPFGDRPRLPFEKVLVGRHGGKTFRDDINRLQCRCIIDIHESFCISERILSSGVSSKLFNRARDSSNANMTD